jgi:hypothetical protein
MDSQNTPALIVAPSLSIFAFYVAPLPGDWIVTDPLTRDHSGRFCGASEGGADETTAQQAGL